MVSSAGVEAASMFTAVRGEHGGAAVALKFLSLRRSAHGVDRNRGAVPAVCGGHPALCHCSSW